MHPWKPSAALGRSAGDARVTVVETIEELVRAWMRGDAWRASAFFAPDAVFHEAGREPIHGRDAIAAHFARFFRDGPVWRFTIDDVIADGERAALAFRFELRIADEWRERAGCALVRREAALLTEWREYQG